MGAGVIRWLALAVLFAAVACSADGQGGPGDTIDRAPSEDQYIDAYATASCGAIRDCCEDLSEYNEEDCLSVLRIGPFFDALDAERYGIPYHSEAAEDCIDATVELTQQCNQHTEEEEVPVTEVCSRVFVGDKTPGDECQVEAECAPTEGASKDCFQPIVDDTGVPNLDEPGRCRLTYRHTDQAEGETCGRDTSSPNVLVERSCDQSAGLLCRGEPPTCTRPPQAGEPCDEDECAPDATCDFGTDTCLELPPAGEPCLQGVDSTQNCADDALCNEESFICEERIPQQVDGPLSCDFSNFSVN